MFAVSSELNDVSSVLLLPVFAVSSELNDVSSVLLVPVFAVSSELMRGFISITVTCVCSE